MTDPTLTQEEDQRLRIEAEGISVSAILRRPPQASALLTLAHGAGAGMEHPHLERLAAKLATENVATLRYQFPYMEGAKEGGFRRPDRAPLLERTVRAAVMAAVKEAPDLPLFAAGRSMGARMSARAHAAEPLPIKGLVFFAFPLHRPVNLNDPDPTLERAEHLLEIRDPMLFLAGTRDRLSRPHLLQDTVQRTAAGTLHVVDTADHSFVPTKKSGRDLDDVEAELARVTSEWISTVAP